MAPGGPDVVLVRDVFDADLGPEDELAQVVAQGRRQDRRGGVVDQEGLGRRMRIDEGVVKDPSLLAGSKAGVSQQGGWTESTIDQVEGSTWRMLFDAPEHAGKHRRTVCPRTSLEF
jgi:hypothetical protein